MEDGLVFEALRRGLITPEEAKQRLSKNTPAVPAKADSGTPPSDGTGGEEGALKRFAKGAFEGIGQAGLGIGQAALGVIQPKPMFGMEATNPALEKAVAPARQVLTNTVDASRQRVSDLGTAGQVGQITGNIAGSAPFTGLGAMRALPAAGTAGSRILGATALGALEGSKQAVGSNDNRLTNAAIGGATGGLVQGGAEGVKQAGKAVIPKIGTEAATLAQRAQDLGIPLSVSQIAPGKIRTTAQKVSQAIPLSGVQKFEESQTTAWNKALASTLGESADNLGPETIKNFLNRTSTGFDNVLKGKSVQIGDDALNAFDNIVSDADLTLTKDLSDVVAKNVKKLKKDIGQGQLSGEKLASFRSELVKRIPNAQGDTKSYLTNIVDEIDAIAQKSLGPDAAQQLSGLRRQWRNYKTVEPLLEKSSDGIINPTQLQQRVAASPYIKSSRSSVGDDDLVDLARIGKQFLAKLGGSDTFEKSSLAAGGVTTALNPVLGAKLLAGVGLNRAFQKLYNQSPDIVEKTIQKSLGNKSGEALSLIKKGAPLDIVAKAIQSSGATKEQADEAVQYITRFASQAKDGTPKKVINVQPSGYNPKTGKIEK